MKGKHLLTAFAVLLIVGAILSGTSSVAVGFGMLGTAVLILAILMFSEAGRI